MTTQQEQLYRQAEAQFAPAIARLAQAMERQSDRTADLVQEIHLELWRSFARFRGQCSLSTWVFRVAHNVAADHVGQATRNVKTVQLDKLEMLPTANDAERDLAESHAMARVHDLLRRVAPIDAQVILLWLEGLGGAEIAEITGLSSNAVSVRTHRAKAVIAKAFEEPAYVGAFHE